MKKIKLILQITFAVILCTVCSAPISETPEVSKPVCANGGVNMASFLAITPEQTTETEIEGVLGDANMHEEPFIDEWTWAYLCDEYSNDRTRLWVTFNTLNMPFVVSRLNYSNPQIRIIDLVDLFGSPELVYKETVKDRSGEFTKYTFAYPSTGIFGSTISTSTPEVSDYVSEIVKEIPQDLHDFIIYIGSQKQVEIIEWSYK